LLRAFWARAMPAQTTIVASVGLWQRLDLSAYVDARFTPLAQILLKDRVFTPLPEDAGHTKQGPAIRNRKVVQNCAAGKDYGRRLGFQLKQKAGERNFDAVLYHQPFGHSLLKISRGLTLFQEFSGWGFVRAVRKHVIFGQP